MRNIIYAVLALSMPSAGHCSSAAVGRVSHFVSEPGGIVVFEQSGPRTSPPGCSEAIAGRRWALDTSNAVGAASLDLLLTAEALGTPVLIVGSDACPDGLGVEKLLSFKNAQ